VEELLVTNYGSFLGKTSERAVVKENGKVVLETPFRDLRQITINDLPVGRNVDETLRLLQAFQFVEEHGEVCPAGWKPGSKSMKADPKGSQEYFGAN